MDDLTSEEEVVENDEVVEEEPAQEPTTEPESPEEPAKPEDATSKAATQLLSEITALRAERRELRQDINSLQTGLDEVRSKSQRAVNETEDLSPMEKLAQDEPDAIPDAATRAAQLKWEREQAKKAAQQQAEERKKEDESKQNQTLQSAVQKSEETARLEYSVGKVGDGLDLDTVLRVGEKYLDEGDKLMISRAVEKGQSFQMAYKRCLKAILESDTEEAKTFKQRQIAHKDKTKKGEVKKGKKTEEEPKETPEPTGDFSHITNFVFGEQQEE